MLNAESFLHFSIILGPRYRHASSCPPDVGFVTSSGHRRDGWAIPCQPPALILPLSSRPVADPRYRAQHMNHRQSYARGTMCFLCVIIIVIQYFANNARGVIDRLKLHGHSHRISLLRANQHSCCKSRVSLRHLLTILHVGPA